MRIVAVTTLHGTFQHFVLEWFAELSLCFRVASHAQLRLTLLQHRNSRDARVLVASLADKGH